MNRLVRATVVVACFTAILGLAACEIFTQNTYSGGGSSDCGPPDCPGTTGPIGPGGATLVCHAASCTVTGCSHVICTSEAMPAILCATGVRLGRDCTPGPVPSGYEFDPGPPSVGGDIWTMTLEDSSGVIATAEQAVTLET